MNRFILLILAQLFALLSFAKSNSVFIIQDETQLIHLPVIDEQYFSKDNRSIDELKSAIDNNPNDTKAIIKLCYLLKGIGEHRQANEYAIKGIEDNLNDLTLLNLPRRSLATFEQKRPITWSVASTTTHSFCAVALFTEMVLKDKVSTVDCWIKK